MRWTMTSFAAAVKGNVVRRRYETDCLHHGICFMRQKEGDVAKQGGVGGIRTFFVQILLLFTLEKLILKYIRNYQNLPPPL